jgi:hypothetical protein
METRIKFRRLPIMLRELTEVTECSSIHFLLSLDCFYKWATPWMKPDAGLG